VVRSDAVERSNHYFTLMVKMRGRGEKRMSNELIVVVHSCLHVRGYVPNPNESSASRERIATSESTRKCSECIVKDAQAKEKR